MMRLSEGVEWGIHCCVSLAWMQDEGPVTGARLAKQFDLPPAYLNKFLQALTRAGILASSTGPAGGFKLARRPEQISLLSIIQAIEGSEPHFRCTEIRQRGAGATRPAHEFANPCAIATAMARAELAWCDSLEKTTVQEMTAAAPIGTDEQMRCWFRDNFPARAASR